MITKLGDKEKMFLAGCIKSIILADGKIEPAEIEDLNRLTGELGFDDFEKYLEVFEKEVRDSDMFWETASKIESTDARDIILKVMYELSLQDGFTEKVERDFLDKLKTIWDEN